MGRKKNSFSKAINHLKSKNIDEKLEMLNEIPTNNTSSIYSVVPNSITVGNDTTKTVPDYSTVDFEIDGTDGKDTSGLFDSSGNSKFISPPGDNSYILGPMVAMYYSYSSLPWTMIGYVRESDRRMVNLAMITSNYQNDPNGRLTTWNGQETDENGYQVFFSYGQLTLEQARWFRDTPKYGNYTGYEGNYDIFYPGPPSSTPDEFGRYRCMITGTPKATKDEIVRGKKAPMDQQGSDNFAAIMDRLRKGKKLTKDEEEFLRSQGFDPKDSDSIGDKLTNFLTNVNKFLGKITNNPVAKILDNLVPSKIIADTITDTIFGVDDSTSYNGQLGLQLFNNVLTGNNAQIKLTAKGRKNMFDSINPDLLRDALQIRPPSDKSHENAIRPNGKFENVLTGGWQAQGGSEFTFDPDTNMLTIHSNKMLRKMDGDKVNSKGKIVDFEDIPNPTTEQIDRLMTDQPAVQKFFDLATDIPGVKSVYSKKEAIELMNAYVPNFVKAVYNFTVEGTASNAVQLRKEMLKLGYTKETQSEREGEGFGGHTYSQESLPIDKLKPEVRKVILDKLKNKNVKESISESRKKDIMKTLKDPVVIRETKQKSYKVRPGKRSNYHQGMDKLIGDVKPQKSFKEPQDVWSQGWQEYNAKLSQGKKNMVLEKIGDGKFAWKYMLEHGTMMDAKNLEEFWGKNPDFYSYFFNGKKYKPIRKEQVKGDYVVFLVDEFGAKSSMLQSELNVKLAEERDKKLFAEYNESIPYEKDPLFKKVSKRLKKEIDYPEKPARKGYPNEPPPKLGPDGFHPDFGKKYKYDKLDPISATTMSNAPTGNSEIDANVKKASLKSKVKEGYSDWRSEIEKNKA